MDAKCKRCRRAGEKLFLKGERCYTPKCPVVRKPYPPGIHGPKQVRRRAGSEFGRQLTEKQKVRFLYGVSEEQFSRYVQEAMQHHGGDVASELVASLETRLDNVVFRLGFTVSRSIARHIVSHGHVFINGKRTNVPSYRVDIGDEIALDPTIKDGDLGKNLETLLKKHEPPVWLSLDRDKMVGKVEGLPLSEALTGNYNLKSIIEFYSR